jgi:hypothetical protein
MLPHRFDHEI